MPIAVNYSQKQTTLQVFELHINDPLARLISAVVVLVLGANMAFAVPRTKSKISFDQTATGDTFQTVDVGFAARVSIIVLCDQAD